MILYQKACDDLCLAIVAQAGKDYLECKQKLYKIDKYNRVYKLHGNGRKTLTDRLREVIGFFYSEWYRLLCDFNPDKLLDILDEEFENWKTRYDRKRAKRG